MLGLPACTLETILYRQSDHILKCYNADIQDYIFRLNLSCPARGLYFTLPQNEKGWPRNKKRLLPQSFIFEHLHFTELFFFKFVNEHLSGIKLIGL